MTIYAKAGSTDCRGIVNVGGSQAWPEPARSWIENQIASGEWVRADAIPCAKRCRCIR